MSTSSANSFDLSRFVEAQQDTYDDALKELKAGQKRTHWMWLLPKYAQNTELDHFAIS